VSVIDSLPYKVIPHLCNSFVKDDLFFKSVYHIFTFVHELFATLKSKLYFLIQFSKCMASNILNHANHVSSNIKHTKSSTKKTDQVICFWQSRMIMSFYKLQLWNIPEVKNNSLGSKEFTVHKGIKQQENKLRNCFYSVCRTLEHNFPQPSLFTLQLFTLSPWYLLSYQKREVF
jgi:hypothetical protein